MKYEILIGLGLLAGIVILYKILNRHDAGFDREINEIVTSDKYKVKGQYDWDK